MNEPIHRIDLTDAEIVLLDGRVRPEAQAVVDSAKARLEAMSAHADIDPKLAAFIADVVAEAKKEGRLIFRRESIRYCSLCGESCGYVIAKRGRRRGLPNYDKPLHLPGVELADRFLIIRGSVALGGCEECINKLMPKLISALAEVRAEIPALIMGHEPRFCRYRNRKCKSCGWTGHEGQMRRERTLMGDGFYPAGCPKCPAENLPLGATNVDYADGFTVAETRVASNRSESEKSDGT